MNKKQIVASLSVAMLACSLPATALAQEAVVPEEPAAVTAGLGLVSGNQDTSTGSMTVDAAALDASVPQKTEQKTADSEKPSVETKSSSDADGNLNSVDEKTSDANAKMQAQAVPAKVAATAVLPNLTFGVGTYKDTGDDIVLDKVLYSYTVNSSTAGVTVDGNYYVIPLQPVKDWLAAHAPEYRLAGALNGESTVRAYGKNGKYILQVEKNPDYKPQPAHTLIMKIGFKKADGTVVYSRDVYADDACVTREGTQYWVSTAQLHEWLAQHPGYRTASAIPAADSKGQCVPVRGEFPYSYLYEVTEVAQPQPAHTLIMKIGFKKADGTVVYSRDVYADDACVTREGTQYWVSTAQLHEWLAQHPGYRTASAIPAADSKGQCVPVRGEFPYSYLYEVTEVAQPQPDQSTTPDSKKPETGNGKQDDAGNRPATPLPVAANAKVEQVAAKRAGTAKGKGLPQTGDMSGTFAGAIAFVGALILGAGARLRRFGNR